MNRRWATQGRKSDLRSCVNREVGDTGKKAEELCVQGDGSWLSLPTPFLPRRGRKAPRKKTQDTNLLLLTHDTNGEPMFRLRFRFVLAAQIIIHTVGYLWVRVRAVSLWGLRPVSVV